MRALGEFEQVLMFGLVALGDKASGVDLRDLVARETGRDRSPGAIHIALERLERRGFVVSKMGDPTPVRGGRRKRLYTLTPAGARALQAAWSQLERLAAGRVERLRELADS